MMSISHRDGVLRRVPAAAVALLLTATSSVAAVTMVAVDAPVASAACALCAGGEYHPVEPSRIFDSRPATEQSPDLPINDVAPFGVKPVNIAATTSSAVTFDIPLLGRVGDASYENGWLPDYVVDSDVLAVVVSVVVVDPGTRGYATTYPAGVTPLTTSAVLGFQAGQSSANLALVRPGVGGRLTVDLRGFVASTAHFVVDVFGWYSTSTFDGDVAAGDDGRGGRSITVSPGRILDTPVDAVGPSSYTEVQIRGARTLEATPRTIVPDSPAVTGVILNLAVAKPSRSTYVSVLPEQPLSGTPSTANVTVQAGEVRSAMVIVPIGADGSIRLFNFAGTTRLVVDVLGYVELRPDETRIGRVIPLTSPFRALDTRRTEFGRVSLGPGQAEQWSFAAFAASVNIASVSVGVQSGLFGNLTNASLARQYPTVPVASNLRVFPTLGAGGAPSIGQLNSSERGAISNMVMLSYGTSTTSYVYNANGYAHYLLDVSAVILAD